MGLLAALPEVLGLCYWILDTLPFIVRYARAYDLRLKAMSLLRSRILRTGTDIIIEAFTLLFIISLILVDYVSTTLDKFVSAIVLGIANIMNRRLLRCATILTH